jgi:small-conductance mechanosensitive channel
MKKYWQALTAFVFIIFLIVITNSLLYAQSKIDGAPVIVNNETLFTIQEKFGLASPQQRAKEISNRIEDVAQDISISLDSVQVAEVEGVFIVSSEDTVLVGITEADAQAMGKTQQELATEYLQKIKIAIAKYRQEHSLLNYLRRWFDNPMVRQFIILVIGIIIISFISRSLSHSVPRYIEDSDMSYRLRKLIIFTGYVVIILFTIILYSDRLAQLTVILGVVGAGVAFALQEVIGSFAGWIAISFGQFYKPGDRVLLGGIMGDVIDISILRTTLMECGDWVKADLYNGRIVRIANSFVFKEPVFNYSGDFHFVWDEITIPVKYGSDRTLARNIFQEVVNEVVGDYITPARAEWKKMVHKYLIEKQRIEPAVTLMANDNWLEFTIRYVVDYKRRRGTKDQLFTRILEEIDKTENRVAIASTTIHLVETPVFDVRLTNKDQSS